MRSYTEQSILANLDKYLPGIQAGFDKTPSSLLSLKQFECGWEAFFVSSSYVVASAVLSCMLEMLLSWVATLALLLALGTLTTSIGILLTDKTPEGQKQGKALLDIGTRAVGVFFLITFAPSFLFLGAAVIASFRSLTLMQNTIPEELTKNIANTSTEIYTHLKQSMNGFYTYCSTKYVELSGAQNLAR